jgi:hypothetical protein
MGAPRGRSARVRAALAIGYLIRAFPEFAGCFSIATARQSAIYLKRSTSIRVCP